MKSCVPLSEQIFQISSAGSWCLLLPCFPSSFCDSKSRCVLGYAHAHADTGAPMQSHMCPGMCVHVCLHPHPHTQFPLSSQVINASLSAPDLLWPLQWAWVVSGADRITLIFWRRNKDFRMGWEMGTSPPDLCRARPAPWTRLPGSGAHPRPSQPQQHLLFALRHLVAGKVEGMSSNRKVIPPQTENSKLQLKFVFPIYLMLSFSF